MTDLFLDQVLHFWLLIWVWRLVDSPPSMPVVAFYHNIVPLPGGVFPDIERFAAVAAGLVLVSFGGAVFVRRALDGIFANAVDYRGSDKSAGKYIGILERLLILSLVLTNSLEGVGFVFAAKSIARYKRITEEQEFSEYYLIGTLLSLVLALAIGFGLRAILYRNL